MINKTEMHKKLGDPPFIDEAIQEYITDPAIRDSMLHFIAWEGSIPEYADYEGQSPFWELNYNGKTIYIVLNGENDICIMTKPSFTQEFQDIICENNLQDLILNNLQPCSRKDGSHCGNCHLPSDAIGVDEVIFGKEIKNLCCGQFVTFDNPDRSTIEVIKKLLEV